MAFDPIRYAAEEDVFRIGGQANPGIAKLSGFKRVYGWEIKKGKGIKGSTVTLNEYPPVEGSIEVKLWTPEQFEAWEEFQKLFKYDPTKKTVAAVDWYHQSTEAIELRSIVCKSISNREHQGQGLYVVKIEVIEYNPPAKKSAVSTPKTSADNSNSKKTPGSSGDPIADAQQAEIARLLKIAGEP